MYENSYSYVETDMEFPKFDVAVSLDIERNRLHLVLNKHLWKVCFNYISKRNIQFAYAMERYGIC